MGKRNVCEALVVEVRALVSASKIASAILRAGDLTAVWKTREERTPRKGVEKDA